MKTPEAWNVIWKVKLQQNHGLVDDSERCGVIAAIQLDAAKWAMTYAAEITASMGGRIAVPEILAARDNLKLP